MTVCYWCCCRWFEGFNWEGLKKGTLTPPIIPNVSLAPPQWTLANDDVVYCPSFSE